jgi:uncharacterized coiled-coil protein SlyX
MTFFQGKIASQDTEIAEQEETISLLNDTANMLSRTIASQNMTISELNELAKHLPDTIRQECEVWMSVVSVCANIAAAVSLFADLPRLHKQHLLIRLLILIKSLAEPS